MRYRVHGSTDGHCDGRGVAIATGQLERTGHRRHGSLEFKPAYEGVSVTSFQGKPIDTMTIGDEGRAGLGPHTAAGVHIGAEESALKVAYGSGLRSGPPSFYGRTYEVHRGRDCISFLIGRAGAGANP